MSAIQIINKITLETNAPSETKENLHSKKLSGVCFIDYHNWDEIDCSLVDNFNGRIIDEMDSLLLEQTTNERQVDIGLAIL